MAPKKTNCCRPNVYVKVYVLANLAPLCTDNLFSKQVEITPEMVRKTAVLAQIQITDEEVRNIVLYCVDRCSLQVVL